MGGKLGGSNGRTSSAFDIYFNKKDPLMYVNDSSYNGIAMACYEKSVTNKKSNSKSGKKSNNSKQRNSNRTNNGSGSGRNSPMNP